MATTTTTTTRIEDKGDIWGTWEELLLVSAVNRHGAKNWDSVAMEIQNRIITTTTTSPFLTPHNCKEKYQDLRRRFMSTSDDKIDDFKQNESETETETDTIPWLEELRKLRVAELRREVQQYDVSIVSLQSKVKRLRDERERSSSKEKENGEVKPDLERVRPELEKNGNSEPVSAEVGEKPISDDDSDRENQSFNESNSTDPKVENQVNGDDESDKKPEPNETVAGELDPIGAGSPEEKPAGEGSYNGSSETIAKDSVGQAFEKSSEPIPKREPGESPELWESVAESKGGGEGTKESSDVQSSASLSKETRRKTDVAVSSSGGEEHEIDEISPAIKRISVKSNPLVKFIEIIKSHKYGYVFEGRLESQETSKYKSLIRQHLDLGTVNKRLKEGQYSGCPSKLFRDLLLLLNNATVYFPNTSVEFTAAIELRQIVSKEMCSRVRKPDQSPKAQPPLTVPSPSLPKTEPEPSDSLLVKSKSSSVPMIACRKRSSISSKGTAAASERKVEKKEAVVEEKKSGSDRKEHDNLVADVVEEQMVIKKGKRDRPASGARSSRANGKSQNNTNSNKPPNSNSNSNSNRNPNHISNPSSSSKGVAADDGSEKAERDKKSNVNTVAKKRSVANFLNRMKKNTPSNGTLLESLKNSGNNSNNSRGNGEQKKGSGGRADGRKEQQAARQSSSRKHSRDQSSPAKRSVGRPPKRNTSSPITPPVSSKRSRETVETESSRQPRKRSRR